MPQDDRIRLRHMLEAAREARALVAGKSRAPLALASCREFAARTTPSG